MKLIPSHLNAYRNKVQYYLKKCNKPQHLSILNSHQLAPNQNSASTKAVERSMGTTPSKTRNGEPDRREERAWCTGMFTAKEGNRTKETGKI